MITLQKARFIALAALILASGSALVAYAETDEAPTALSADQFIAAIRAAGAAKAGQILSVEAETEKGVAFCEVKVLAGDGKTYEVLVSAATGQVTGAEVDDEDEDEGEKED